MEETSGERTYYRKCLSEDCKSCNRILVALKRTAKRGTGQDDKPEDMTRGKPSSQYSCTHRMLLPVTLDHFDKKPQGAAFASCILGPRQQLDTALIILEEPGRVLQNMLAIELGNLAAGRALPLRVEVFVHPDVNYGDDEDQHSLPGVRVGFDQ